MSVHKPSFPHSFFKFWKESIIEGAKKSWETGFGKTIEIGAFALAFGLLGIKIFHKSHKSFDVANGEEVVNFWVAISPLFAGVIWFLIHVFIQPYRIYREAEDKYQIEIEKNRPKFKLSCNKDTEGRALKIPNTNGAFFRMKVETDCFGGIKNCVGNLLSIEKDGIQVFGHDTLKLPFAKAEDPKSLEKTLSQNTPEWLDVLAIHIYQPPQRSDFEVMVLAHNPHLIKKEEQKDRVWIATRQHTAALDIHGNYIFREDGEYILHINVTGDDAPTENAKLKFTWNGYAKDSIIEKID